LRSGRGKKSAPGKRSSLRSPGREKGTPQILGVDNIKIKTEEKMIYLIMRRIKALFTE